ncbi:LysR substrate-binding domain-containing protein [Paraburkholderia aromaticivorans]|uniref:LysR substrate-binding domain-containing protein n=1 Tax=Paraburkholderia aromaticivorans TaxID=2026199 RepID=A0A248VGU3_9BURK|nr:hypothetical protein CJU94_08465 [Paraburkholderia aromaticivorans]
MASNLPQPLDAGLVPRFAGIPTFMRLPAVTSLASVDIALVGVPWDGGTTNRAGAHYVERDYMLESNKPRHMTLNRAATAFSMEAILTMLLTGTYIGYLPCHHVQRWVDDEELFARAQAAFSYSSVFGVITRQGKELDATTGLMVESMSTRPAG